MTVFKEQFNAARFLTILLTTTLVAAAPASASLLHFDVLTSNKYVTEHSTWDQSDTPFVNSSSSDGFAGTPNDLGHTTVAVSNGIFTASYSGGEQTFDQVYYVWGHNDYFGNTSGNLNTDMIGVENISPNGTPLFSGSVDQPVFAAGTWFSAAGDTTITVTGATVAAAVPEPASLALVITGLGLVGAASRRRRATVAS